MELLRNVVVLLHIVGFAITFGAWAAEAVAKLVILVALGGLLGVGNARQRRTGNPVARPVFISVGVLSLVAAAIAVMW